VCSSDLHPRLHFVEHEEQAMLVAEVAKRTEKGPACVANAALALDGLDQDGSGLVRDCGSRGIEIAERHLVETIDNRAEPREVLFLIARGNRRERATVKGSLKGEHAVAFRLAAVAVMLPGHLDAALK